MVAPPTPQRITLQDAFDRYIRSMEGRVIVGSLAKRTVQNYEADLTQFIDVIGGDVIADDITGPQIDDALIAFGKRPDQRFKVQREGGQAVSTQRRFYQSLSQFFVYAERHRWVQMSPIPWATLQPRVRGELREERTSLSPSQARALLEHGAGRKDPNVRPHEQNYERDRLILALLTILGPRVSEVSQANLAAITRDPDGATWRILGKGDKVRHVPLSPALEALLDDYLAVRPVPSTQLPATARKDAEVALFRTGRGQRLSQRDIQRLMHRSAQRVLTADPQQYRDLTPHALRHTAATLMLSQGWDVKVVSKLLGHANISATQRYLDEIPGELITAVRANPLLSNIIPEPTRVEDLSGAA